MSVYIKQLCASGTNPFLSFKVLQVFQCKFSYLFEGANNLFWLFSELVWY